MLTSEQYAYNDITIVMGGRVLNQATGIEVEFGYEHEIGRGKGGKAQFINEKNHEVTGTISLLQSEVEALIETYGEDYQKQYLDVIWNFSPNNGIQHRTHVIKGVKLGKIKMGLKQGDAYMSIDVPFKALDIKLNQ
jgi:hypothetical protein